MPHPDSARDQLQETRGHLADAVTALAQIDALPQGSGDEVETILRRFRTSLSAPRKRQYDRQVNTARARLNAPTGGSHA